MIQFQVIGNAYPGMPYEANEIFDVKENDQNRLRTWRQKVKDYPHLYREIGAPATPEVVEVDAEALKDLRLDIAAILMTDDGSKLNGKVDKIMHRFAQQFSSASSPKVESAQTNLTVDDILKQFKLHDGTHSNYLASDVVKMIEIALASKVDSGYTAMQALRELYEYTHDLLHGDPEDKTPEAIEFKNARKVLDESPSPAPVSGYSLQQMKEVCVDFESAWRGRDWGESDDKNEFLNIWFPEYIASLPAPLERVVTGINVGDITDKQIEEQLRAYSHWESGVGTVIEIDSAVIGIRSLLAASPVNNKEI